MRHGLGYHTYSFDSITRGKMVVTRGQFILSIAHMIRFTRLAGGSIEMSDISERKFLLKLDGDGVTVISK
jgi:hypothetical protein